MCRALLVFAVVGCASAEPERRPPRAPAPAAQEHHGLGCGTSADAKYRVDGADPDDPAFGALTTTIIVDGRRLHFGAQG